MADIIKHLRIPFPRFPLVKDDSDDWNPIRGDYNGGVFAGAFGSYHDRWCERVGAEAPAGGGNTFAESSAVPAGYVYVLQAVSAHHDDATARRVQISLGGQQYTIIAQRMAADTWEAAIANGCWVLKEGDTVLAVAVSLAEGRSLTMLVWGYKVKL